MTHSTSDSPFTQPETKSSRLQAIKKRLDDANINGVCQVDVVDHKSGIPTFDIVLGAEDPVYASSMAECYERVVAELYAHAAADLQWLIDELDAAAESAVSE